MNPRSTASGLGIATKAMWALVASLLAVSVMGTGLAGAAGPTVTGTGSSFAALEIDQWRSDVKTQYDLTINYQGAGSTQGRLSYLNGTVDFGATDIEFQPEEQRLIDASDRKSFVYVPISAGPLAFMFNLKGADGRPITQLNLTRRVVCRIFTEENMRWDDPEIAAANPGVPLRSENVRAIVRADGSGTSYVLSEFCIAVAPDLWNAYRQRVAEKYPNENSQQLRDGHPVSTWPQNTLSAGSGSSTGSDGVAQTVSLSESSITYVDAARAAATKFQGGGWPVASVQNAAGVFQVPEPANATVALGYATPRDNGTFQLHYDGADERAYFPSTYSYVIAQTTGFDPEKGQVLGAFLNFAVTAGQRRADQLVYSRLSTVLVNLALDKIQQIPGAPARPTDLGGAPPPPDVAAGVATPGVVGGPGGPAQGGGVAGGAGAAGGGATSGAAAGGGTAGALDGAATPEQAAAAAAAAAAAEVEAAAAAENAEAAASRSGTGPGTREVIFTLLIGALLVAGGSFLSKGVQSSWSRR
jgi:phosphate transport system substrate-binding protein